MRTLLERCSRCLSKHHNRFCQATITKNKATNPKTAPATIAATVEAGICDEAGGAGAAEVGGASDMNREKDRAVGTELIVAVTSTEIGRDAFGHTTGTNVRISAFTPVPVFVTKQFAVAFTLPATSVADSQGLAKLLP